MTTAYPLRSVDGRVNPNSGEIGVYWIFSDYTDIFTVLGFEADDHLQDVVDRRGDECELILSAECTI